MVVYGNQRQDHSVGPSGCLIVGIAYGQQIWSLI